MYKKNKFSKSTLTGVERYEGEPIEHKVERLISNKEPIKDGAPLIYTERKEGVLHGFNIRTDRFEVATDAMDLVTKSIYAKRDEKAGIDTVEKVGKVVKLENDGGAESIQGT